MATGEIDSCEEKSVYKDESTPQALKSYSKKRLISVVSHSHRGFSPVNHVAHDFANRFNGLCLQKYTMQ